MKAVGLQPKDFERAVKHLEAEGIGRPCRQEHCGGHLEQSEVKMLTGWNSSKLIAVREKLVDNVVITVTILRGKAGRPRLLWHLTGNMPDKPQVSRMEYTLEQTLGGD